jgi:hypothetical protein
VLRDIHLAIPFGIVTLLQTIWKLVWLMQKWEIYKMEKDLFGFEKAIQLDHLTKEQIDELLKMLSK